MDNQHAVSPHGEPLGDKSFHFDCHAGVSCYKMCCRRLELYLYPYDIVRLKNRLRMTAADFLYKHTRLGQGSHQYFPSIMLNMNDDEEYTCPFLGEEGCLVYRDRPSACRTYPLERAVEYTGEGGLTAHYFMTDHSYCKGHAEEKELTVRQWEREQRLHDYNLMNDLWAEVDALFATNPWQGEGAAGPLQQLAFMVCYNIDEFRVYCQNNRLPDRFLLDKDQRKRIMREDEELLKFGFRWLQYTLADRPTLIPR